MRVQAVTAALLGLSTVLVAGRPIPAQEPRPSQAPKVSAPKSKDGKEALSAAVDQLVEQLRRHPAQPTKAADRVAGLYMIDVSTSEVTLIADEPDPGITFCGSASWSNDGKRILFDAMRPERVQRARLKAIELVGGQLTVTDLGVGNCPNSSPAGGRIAFLLNHGGVPGAQAGIWLMQADGSQRRPLGSWGRPKWSPDSRQVMIIDFGSPVHVTLMDLRSEQSVPLQIPDLQIYTTPSWASDGTIVAAVGSGFGETIALLDVTDPAHGKVKEVLWKMNFKGGLDVQPSWPAYEASTRRCVFVGAGIMETPALYSLQKGQAGPPRRLERQRFDTLMQDVAISPDGRYVLFSSNRTGPRPRAAAPGGGDAR